MRKGSAFVALGCLLSLADAHARAPALFTPAYCSPPAEDDCRGKAAVCINRACQGLSPEQQDQFSECRRSCFISLQTCLTTPFCD